MKRKIFAGFIVMSLLTGLVFFGLSTLMIRKASENELVSRLKKETMEIARVIGSNDALKTLEGLASLSRISLIAPDGDVLFDNRRDESSLDDHINRPEIRLAMSKGEGSSVRRSATQKEVVVYVALKLQDGSILRLSETEAAADSLIKALWPLLLVGLVFTFGLCLPVASGLTRALVRPILLIDLEKPEDQDCYPEIVPLLKRMAAQNKQNREQLKTLEAQSIEMNTLLGGMNEGFIALNPSRFVMMINDAACQILDTDKDGAMGKSLLEINRRLQFGPLFQEMEKKGSATTLMTIKGRHYLASCGSVDREAVLLLSDQTEKVEGDKLRKSFTANVSHELRTPLTAICGYAELLSSGFVKPEDLAAISATIHRESQRMLNLVEDILRLSSLDEGYPEGRRERLNLYGIAKSALESLRPIAREKELSLYFEGKDAFVQGDETLLFALCRNLIDNAVKYNLPRGSVRVSVERKDRAILTISDTGIGIAPEHQNRVFERFYRTDKSRSKATGGTGLGLSIVKHAAEYHRAEIRLKSEEGVGTRVQVCFPLCAEEESPA